MEQSESFQQAAATIKRLEQQLALYVHSSTDCEKSAVEAEKEIEEHFAKVMNSLAARKSVLLKEVAQKVKAQKESVDATCRNLETAIEASKQAFKASSLMYSVNRSVSEAMWKEITNVSIPSVHDMRIKVDLTNAILGVIQSHSRVYNSYQRFSVANTVTTFAGSIATVTGRSDGNGVNARFTYPMGVCIDPNNEWFFVCDSGSNAIRKITMQGMVSTLAYGFNEPTAIALNRTENVYYVTSGEGHNVSKITSTGTVSVFVGTGSAAHVDGAPTTAKFNRPKGIAIDQKTGTIFVSEWNNHTIRKITPQGQVSTLAGCPGSKGFADGNARTAKFNEPWGICYDDQNQSLLVSDYSNNKLRRVNINGDVSTVCNVQGPANVVVTANGIILVASYDANKIFKITRIGQSFEAEVLVGSGEERMVDGTPGKCGFRHPVGITVHEPSESCFVSDYYSSTIRKISFH